MKKRNCLVTAVLLALAMVMAAVSGGAAFAADQHITFALHSIPDSIDPGITSETYSSAILYNLFEGLLTYDAQNNLIPGQAEKWELSDDGLVYTFHLRDGLKWSDGTPITAEDFRYSWLRVITPKTGSLYADQLLPYVVGAQEFFDGKIGEDRVGIKAVDKKTLTVTLKSPTPFFLGLLSTYTFFPVQKATVEANNDKWTLSDKTYISNGPFKVTKINFNESYEFVRNEHYWDAKNVKLDRLTFIYILDTSTALTAFRAREIDGFWEAPASDLPVLRAESDELVTVKAFGTTFHLMNNSAPPFDNPLVRKAFNLAIDRRALIEDVLGTNDSPAYSLVAPGYVVGGVDVTEGRSSYGMAPGALAKEAKAALAEAGYPDGKGFPDIVYYYSTNDTYKKTVEALSAMLEKNLGIKITLKTADWAVFYADVQAGKYQIGQYGWGGDYLHPMTFLPLTVTNGVNNYSNYSNPEYDALVVEIQRTTDQKRAAELIRKAEDTMMKDYPILPLFHRSYSYMMRKGTAGYFRSPLNNLYFRDAYVTD
ncbi:MAG: peptide ABC transporter substrate-binding protein [Synergistaceae bacterium]|nr:peptide ABC transporter substrate-binding protein [Synergistaceae bacterium]